MQLENGLSQALSGANRLRDGAAQALAGASTLGANINASAGGIPDITGQIGSTKSAVGETSNAVASAKGQAGSAAGAIQSAIGAVDKSDPNYGAIVASLNRASAQVSSLSGSLSTAAGSASKASHAASNAAYSASGLAPGFKALRDSASQLASGISQLKNGNAQLAGGISQLAGGGGQLRSGLGQLTSGAGQLEAGLALLSAGTGQLATGLAPAPTGAGQIATGLGIMQAAVRKSRGQLPSTKDLETLFKQSPGMFNSGYFVLAAVEGARGSDRNAATFAINLLHGGTAGQIVVISKYASSAPESTALHNQLVAMARAFATKNHVAVAVGGPGGSLIDLTGAAKSKIWLDVAVIAIALALVLALALRAIVLPVVTVVFNLLVVAAAFGVIQMLFGGSNPPLGGPGYLDPITTISVFTVAFGISVCYSTLLLMRTREEYVTSDDGRQAIATGMRETAAAATGAGLAMVAAVIPFAATELINVRELGVGVGVAVLLDVILLRPVLLPAAEVALGRFGWWPTKGHRPPAAPGPAQRTRRLPRLGRIPHPHLPHRGPAPAHQ